MDMLPALWLTPADDALGEIPPLFMVGNSYLLRLRCGRRDWLLDGNPHALSAARFRSAAAAARSHGRPVNEAWLDDEHSSDIEHDR